MTTTEAENLAQRLHDSHGGQSCAAIEMIRKQAAEIERLKADAELFARHIGLKLEPVAWTVQMGIDLLKSGASITVFPKSGERDVPLYTHPAPDHTALLRQALAALDDSRDDVCECLNMVMEHAGYERYDKRIAAYKEQLAKHDAAIAAIEGALK